MTNLELDSKLFQWGLSIEKTKELIGSGANANAINHIKQTPLFYTKNLKIARLLVENGADVNRLDFYGRTVMHYIQNEKIAEYLISCGIKLNVLDKHNKPAIYYVDKLNLINILYASGAIPFTRSHYEIYKSSFKKEQQDIFDICMLLTNNDDDFFNMCLKYSDNILDVSLKDIDF